jgi:hypothetical protein
VKGNFFALSPGVTDVSLRGTAQIVMESNGSEGGSQMLTFGVHGNAGTLATLTGNTWIGDHTKAAPNNVVVESGGGSLILLGNQIQFDGAFAGTGPTPIVQLDFALNTSGTVSSLTSHGNYYGMATNSVDVSHTGWPFWDAGSSFIGSTSGSVAIFAGGSTPTNADISGDTGGAYTANVPLNNYSKQLASVPGSNFVVNETGANNAIVGSGQYSCMPRIYGLTVQVALAHSLQAGANTFNYCGVGAKPIRSHFNSANNIGTAYDSSGVITLQWAQTAKGQFWLDMSQ